MFEKIKRENFLTTQQLEDILNKFHIKKEVEKKKYTWVIILVSVMAIAGVGFAIYKFFFEPIDDYDDDDDYDDIDYDEDFDDYEDVEDEEDDLEDEENEEINEDEE